MKGLLEKDPRKWLVWPDVQVCVTDMRAETDSAIQASSDFASDKSILNKWIRVVKTLRCHLNYEGFNT